MRKTIEELLKQERHSLNVGSEMATIEIKEGRNKIKVQFMLTSYTCRQFLELINKLLDEIK